MIKQNDKLLLIDVSNLMHRIYWANKSTEEEDLIGLIIQTSINSLNSYYKQYKPTKIFLAFDSFSWRKKYTQSSKKKVTNKIYKGQRNLNLTPSERKRLKLLEESIDTFYDILTSCTTIITAKENLLEADDLIAGITQLYPNNQSIIISSDKDFTQLVKPNIKLINPLKNVEIKCDDINYFMFEKCFRGDVSDNVQNAYPRLRSNKIKEAYIDPFLKTNIMKHQWNDPDGNSFLVEDIFNENKLLMDLTQQPSYIREILELTILDEINKKREFDLFKLNRKLSSLGLVNIKNNISSYIPIFSL